MPFSSPREHTRHWYFQVVTLCILLLPAAQAAAAGSLTPATLSALVHAKNGTGAASRAALQLRGNNTLVILPVAGVQADVVLRADAGESQSVRYRAVRANGHEIHAGACAPGKEVAWTIPAGVRCLLQIEAGRTPATLEVRNAGIGAHATPSAPAHLDRGAGQQSFLVPKGTRSFTLTASAQGGSGKAVVRDPAGKPAASATLSTGEDTLLKVTVDAKKTDRFWSVSTEPAGEEGFTSVRLAFSAEIPPFLAPDPGGMALPFIHYPASGALLMSDSDRSATIEAVIAIEPQPDRFVRALMRRAGASRAMWTTRPSPFTTGRVRILLPNHLASGAYELKTTLQDQQGAIVATHVQQIHAANGFAHVGDKRPLMELICQSQTDDSGASYQLCARLGIDPTCYSQVSVHRALYREGQSQPAFKEEIGHPTGEVLPLKPPADIPSGLYRMALSLVSRGGKTLATADRSFYLEGNRCFMEASPRPQTKKAPLNKSQRARGYVLFSRVYHEAFPYNYEPPKEDIGRPLYVWATPGEDEPATFGVYTLKPLQKAHVKVGLLSRVGGGGVINPSSVEVRLARFWPQRTEDQSATYRLIPELLEPVTTATIPTGRISQYWLTLHIPPGTPAGDYRGLVTYQPENAQASQLKLLVKVLPFRLERPASRTWGLYADSARWRGATDASIEREMRDMKAHGIDALALTALAHGTLTHAGEKLTVDFTPLSRLMGIYKRAGLRGPVILDLRDLPQAIAQLRGTDTKPDDPAVQRLAGIVLSELAVRAETEKWPEAVYQLADEPDARCASSLATARALLSLGKRASLPTLALLASPHDGMRELDALLGIPCYGAEAVAADKNGVLRKALKEANKPFWWYGSGCTSPRLEGNLTANRYLTGIAFWRSGAAAHWTETYQRPLGDPYSDFDGDGQVAGKDLCLTYPAPAGGAAVPTLQWEGIREGYDDFRYLYTFQQMVARAKRSGHERGAKYAAQVEKEAQERLDRLPWGAEPEGLTAYEAYAFRKWLSKYMGTLVNKLNS
jgi:hypothetical protein